MSNSRYPTLAATLEKRIAQGIYRDRLPTVRELAAEFKVSKQTVTLALRPLIVKGILKAEGRRGNPCRRSGQVSGHHRHRGDG